MKRILKLVVFILAAVYFIVDAIFLTIATPLARWMARQGVFVRLRKWIGSLRPYPSLALFAVPLIILEPAKPVATYLIATGQIAAGVTVLIVGELLKLVIVERLFKLCRRKLLKIPTFARGYAYWRQGVDWIYCLHESMAGCSTLDPIARITVAEILWSHPAPRLRGACARLKPPPQFGTDIRGSCLSSVMT